MTKILGLSGKMQSGKNTCLNWLISCQLVAQDLVDWSWINEKGQIVVPAMVDDKVQEGIFDIENPSKAVQDFLHQFIYPIIRPYSFANPLKRFCIDVLGLTHMQCFGTNEDKDSLTKLLWENMANRPKDKVGFMTAREVLQHFGTNVCRKINNDCWVEATIKSIQQDQPELAVITDLRFPNEVKCVQRIGGKVLRFRRAPFAGSDSHPSETALDNWEGVYDHVLDNRVMDIPTQNKAVQEILDSWGYSTYTTVEKIV